MAAAAATFIYIIYYFLSLLFLTVGPSYSFYIFWSTVSFFISYYLCDFSINYGSWNLRNRILVLSIYWRAISSSISSFIRKPLNKRYNGPQLFTWKSIKKLWSKYKLMVGMGPQKRKKVKQKLRQPYHYIIRLADDFATIELKLQS